jgi:hypothetical protein
MYYNGWVSTDRGHGHGVYTQNASGSNRLIRDNIIFSNCSHGIQAYGSETAPLDGITFDNNAIFLHPERNFLLGGGMVAHRPTITQNYSYNGAGASQLGYDTGLANAVVTDNFFLKPDGTTALRFRSVDQSQIDAFARNLIWGTVAWYWTTPVPGFDESAYPQNVYTTTRPTGVLTFVRPNTYESGRANIIVLNFDKKSSVSVDVSRVLKSGDSYELRDAQNYFGPAVLSGRYRGSPIDVPMTGTAVVKPIGSLDPAFIHAHTPSEFGAFVLLKR